MDEIDWQKILLAGIQEIRKTDQQLKFKDIKCIKEYQEN